MDTYHGLIILYTAFSLPYVIWMMRGYLEDIPLELEESALVDGCTRIKALLRRSPGPGGPTLTLGNVALKTDGRQAEVDGRITNKVVQTYKEVAEPPTKTS